MYRSLLLASLLLACVAALGVGSPALATPLPTCASVQSFPDHGPLRCSDDDTELQVWDDPADPWANCDGFYIAATYFTQRTVTDWWTHAVVQVAFTGTLSNSTDATKTASYAGRFSKKIDYTTDPPTISRSGITTRVVVPGGGLVFHSAGTEVFDAFHHGPTGDIDALCAALS